MEIADIGRTALIETDRLRRNGSCVFSTCEYSNPTGSHTDRIFIHAINELENNIIFFPTG
ncbi:hypothetical protein YEEN111655_05505 [Yersinia entomophaga]